MARTRSIALLCLACLVATPAMALRVYSSGLKTQAQQEKAVQEYIAKLEREKQDQLAKETAAEEEKSKRTGCLTKAQAVVVGAIAATTPAEPTTAPAEAPVETPPVPHEMSLDDVLTNASGTPAQPTPEAMPAAAPTATTPKRIPCDQVPDETAAPTTSAPVKPPIRSDRTTRMRSDRDMLNRK